MVEISDYVAFLGFLVTILIILVIIVMVYIVKQKRKVETAHSNSQRNQLTIQNFQNQLGSVSSALQNLPRSNEVDMITEKIQKLEGDFVNLNEDVTMKMFQADGKLDTANREYLERLSITEKKILNETTQKILEKTTDHISATSVNKEEFDRLKSRIETLIGAEIDARRLHYLNMIFGDTDRKDVISWRCKVIQLLKRGLAPQAEEDVLAAEGISAPKAKKFLKELRDMGVVEQKKIDAYWLSEEFLWLTKYMNDVELLIHRIKEAVRNEKNYQKHIKDNLELIEPGLIFEAEQHCIDNENEVDLLCIDKNGKKLFIELKFPYARPPDHFQLVRYQKAYISQPGVATARFMLIAQSIPDLMKDVMKKDELEFREISF